MATFIVNVKGSDWWSL